MENEVRLYNCRLDEALADLGLSGNQRFVVVTRQVRERL
jgi:uncharacterized protein YjiS (DUF1127 family)